MDLRICSRCKKPICFENNNAVSECDCEAPLNPWECDEDVYHLVKALWDKGYETEFSCSGHSVSRYYSDANKWVVSESIDLSGYIVIPGTCVRIKDLEKYKYGCAYIEKSNTIDLYIEQMRSCIDIPINYNATKNDKLFAKFINDYNSKEDAESILKQLEHPSLWYAIRTESDYSMNKYNLSAYMKLMEARYDMAKLISILPDNVKEK